MKHALRWVQYGLFAFAFVLLGYCAFDAWSSWNFQRQAKAGLSGKNEAPPKHVIQAGDVIGRVDVDRLNVSVAVVEGAGDAELQHAAGHVSGTVFPGQRGNTAIAAHRDTFFRPLRNIRTKDLIRVTTPSGEYRYRVISTKIVSPENVEVLKSGRDEELTLVTCFPFYYVGSAPKRFIVQARREPQVVEASVVPQPVVKPVKATPKRRQVARTRRVPKPVETPVAKPKHHRWHLFW